MKAISKKYTVKIIVKSSTGTPVVLTYILPVLKSPVQDTVLSASRIPCQQ